MRPAAAQFTICQPFSPGARFASGTGAMPITVFSCCTYSTLRRSRTQEQWAAVHFVKAIKGLPLKGYAQVPLPGGERGYLDQDTVRFAPDWFVRMAVTGIDWECRSTRPMTLVPIPDAACDVSVLRPAKVARLASGLASALAPKTASVLDVLRWAKPMPTAHQAGGTRDPQELYGRLRLALGKLPPEIGSVILVDDVLASGGHLRAAAAFLADCGAEVVAAVCAGRVDDSRDRQLEPFSMHQDALPDFLPAPHWLPPPVSPTLPPFPRSPPSRPPSL